jgi:hypothetical protein
MAKDTARLGYLMMVCPKLEYAWTVTPFTQDQCDKITAPVLRSCMAQMGYNTPADITRVIKVISLLSSIGFTGWESAELSQITITNVNYCSVVNIDLPSYNSFIPVSILYL